MIFLNINLFLKQQINLIERQPQWKNNITCFLLIFTYLLNTLINTIKLIYILSFSWIVINNLVLLNICHLLYKFDVWNLNFPNSLQKLWAVNFTQIEYSIWESICDDRLLGINIESLVENFLLQNNPGLFFQQNVITFNNYNIIFLCIKINDWILINFSISLLSCTQ